MKNHLQHSENPYLRMHMDQPIHWNIWSPETFEKAKREDKPIFLSIGYSTCHWCHVMAEESFEDHEVADKLNDSFISIKVDREEHPEIDTLYMNFCQALTGTGGWPLSVFLTPDQKPFFAGTYFPKNSRKNRIGFSDLLDVISEKWNSDRNNLIHQAEFIFEEVSELMEQDTAYHGKDDLCEIGSQYLVDQFDHKFGGFGSAPKFPTPHKLLFLIDLYETDRSQNILDMLEFTAEQMAKGGIFDHIGGGFSRYSTDRMFLVPHFEKMLYDNALLIYFYGKLFEITGKSLYLRVAELTASYLCREMKSSDCGFYTAQDADSENEEGKYYIFSAKEIFDVLGSTDANLFCERYDITEEGNFEGKNIPNLLNKTLTDQDFILDDPHMIKLRSYRKKRGTLFTDEKILTAGNSMIIAAFSLLYRVSGKKIYSALAEETEKFIQNHLLEETTLYKGCKGSYRMGEGTLDDYAWYIYALIHLYEVTFKQDYLDNAKTLLDTVIDRFYDHKKGGFFMQSRTVDSLILKIKETYDGAIPSGNSIMAENLRMMALITEDGLLKKIAKSQQEFLCKAVGNVPQNAFFFLMSLHREEHPPRKIICSCCNQMDREYIFKKASSRDLILKRDPDSAYPLINNRNTFYVCDESGCKLPSNEIDV